MPTLGKWGKKGLAAISKFAGRNKADVAKVDGISLEASATVYTWVAVARDGRTAWAESTDYTSWTEYRVPTNAKDDKQVSYGKDSAGDPLWVKVRNQANGEIYYSSDPTSGASGWTQINVNGGSLTDVAWGNDVWVAVGKMNLSGYNKNILRSTNGTTWNSVSLAGISSVTTNSLYAIASDGSGTWLLPQDDRVYKSTDDGQTWAEEHDFNDGRTIKDICYTLDSSSNGVWALVGGDENFSVAMATDTTSWTDTNKTAIGAAVQTMAAGAGTFISANGPHICRSTDTGATWTVVQNTLAYGSAREIATDGNGNWVVVHSNGGISYSNDDGATWNDGGDTGSEYWDGVCASVYLPV